MLVKLLRKETYRSIHPMIIRLYQYCTCPDMAGINLQFEWLLHTGGSQHWSTTQKGLNVLESLLTDRRPHIFDTGL